MHVKLLSAFVYDPFKSGNGLRESHIEVNVEERMLGGNESCALRQVGEVLPFLIPGAPCILQRTCKLTIQSVPWRRNTMA